MGKSPEEIYNRLLEHRQDSIQDQLLDFGPIVVNQGEEKILQTVGRLLERERNAIFLAVARELSNLDSK